MWDWTSRMLSFLLPALHRPFLRQGVLKVTVFSRYYTQRVDESRSVEHGKNMRLASDASWKKSLTRRIYAATMSYHATGSMSSQDVVMRDYWVKVRENRDDPVLLQLRGPMLTIAACCGNNALMSYLLAKEWERKQARKDSGWKNAFRLHTLVPLFAIWSKTGQLPTIACLDRFYYKHGLLPWTRRECVFMALGHLGQHNLEMAMYVMHQAPTDAQKSNPKAEHRKIKDVKSFEEERSMWQRMTEIAIEFDDPEIAFAALSNVKAHESETDLDVMREDMIWWVDIWSLLCRRSSDLQMLWQCWKRVGSYDMPIETYSNGLLSISRVLDHPGHIQAAIELAEEIFSSYIAQKIPLGNLSRPSFVTHVETLMWMVYVKANDEKKLLAFKKRLEARYGSLKTRKLWKQLGQDLSMYDEAENDTTGWSHWLAYDQVLFREKYDGMFD